jgi:hypothetical protein
VAEAHADGAPDEQGAAARLVDEDPGLLLDECSFGYSEAGTETYHMTPVKMMNTAYWMPEVTMATSPVRPAMVAM